MNHWKATADTRQMLLAGRLLDVSIHLAPRSDDGLFDLQGKILPVIGLDPGLCSVELTVDNGKRRFAEADDTGDFTFSELSGGHYRLTVTGPGFEITMPATI